MRKWQDLAAPDDPGSWYAVGNMWPTKRGTYETADGSTGSSVTAASSSTVVYAWRGGGREYVVNAIATSKIWEYSAGTATDRTGGVTVGTYPMMAAYGSVTICVMGNANATVKSTGGNFSALAGAPKGNIICVQSNAVLIFNTDTASDGWAASDVGDYTNWTTGEAASGRIITTPGDILAAVPYGNDVLVFKRNAIYRMTYVGGVVKWQVQVAWKTSGVSDQAAIIGSPQQKYQAVATAYGVAYKGDAFPSSGFDNGVYLFDGSSPPKPLNPFTSLANCLPVFLYDPVEQTLILAPASGSNGSGTVKTGASTTTNSWYYYYNFQSDLWGVGFGGSGEDYQTGANAGDSANGVLQGDYYERAEISTKPVYWRYLDSTTGAMTRNAPSAPGSSSSCYLQTAKVGTDEYKTAFDRLTPLLRRRTDLGTDSASLELTLFRERDDTTAQTTRTISESSTRKRFDLKGGASTDNFARFKVTWTALDVEVDDFRVAKSKIAGTD